MYVNNRQGLLTSLIYAIAGIVLAFATLHANKFLLPGAPGILVLLLFFSEWEIGHGWIILIFVTNPLVYAIAGYTIGGFSKTRRQVAYITTLIAVLLLFSSIYMHVVRPGMKHRKSVRQSTRKLTEKLAIDPNDVTTVFCMGVHRFATLGQPDLAKPHFQRVIELEKFGGEYSAYVQRSFLYLALIHQFNEEDDEADEYYKEFLATDPDLENDLVLLNYNRNYLKRQTQKNRDSHS